MRIVLINPRFGPVEDPLIVRSRVFPYGLAHVAQAFLEAGHEVEVYDPFAVEPPNQEIERHLGGLKTDWVGISAMSTQYPQVQWLAETIRRDTDCRIMLGGLLATHSYRTVLSRLPVDLCVIGEGLLTGPRALAARESDWGTIPGLAFRTADGEIRCTGPGEFVADLNTLARAPYHLFDMERYCQGRLWIRDPSIKSRYLTGAEAPARVMTVLSAWGCPYRCRFCSRSTERARLKSIPTLVRELAYLKEQYGIEGIHFVDELLFVNKQRGLELAAAMKDLDLLWDAQARVNTVDEELCRAIAAAGCTAIGLGTESGSNRILAAMNKTGVTREKTLAAVAAARSAGLLVRHQLILGYPGETRESVYETVQLYKEMHSPGRRFALILPLPGSALYEDCRKDGRIPDEEAYLKKIARGYGGEVYFMNFMDMSDEQVLALKREAESAMERNYIRYLLRTGRWFEVLNFLPGSTYHRVHIPDVLGLRTAAGWALRKLGLIRPVP